jgi:hypothetical protein
VIAGIGEQLRFADPVERLLVQDFVQAALVAVW